MRIATLDELHPQFRRRLERLLGLLRNEGIPLEPFETIRPPSRQEALYARGRDPHADDFGRTVTRARAYQSAHQFGMGADLVFKVDGRWTWDEPESGQWSRLRHLAMECGLESLSFEQPHVQIADFDWRPLVRGPETDEAWFAWLRAGAVVAIDQEADTAPIVVDPARSR